MPSVPGVGSCGLAPQLVTQSYPWRAAAAGRGAGTPATLPACQPARGHGLRAYRSLAVTGNLISQVLVHAPPSPVLRAVQAKVTRLPHAEPGSVGTCRGTIRGWPSR